MSQHITVEEHGNVAVVSFTIKRIEGELLVQQMGYELFLLVDDQEKKNIILNFGELEYVSSVALGKLIVLSKKCKEAGGKLVICEVPDQSRESIYSVFQITKLNKLFEVYKQDPKNPGKTLNETLASFPS